jgi:hypothetical protein
MPFAPGFRNAQRDYPLIAHAYRTVSAFYLFVGYNVVPLCRTGGELGCPRADFPVPVPVAPCPSLVG